MATNLLRTNSVRDNVVRLPTAAHSQIKNPARAARAYRAAEPDWPGERMLPAQRDARALTVHRSPELLILMAIFKQLSPEQQRGANDLVHQIAIRANDEASLEACAIVDRLGGAA